MSLRLFVDHCVPSIFASALAARGFDVVLLKQRLPQNTLDEDVIATATAEDRILLTLDRDFSDLLNFPPSKFAGILMLQLQGHQSELAPMSNRLCNFLSVHTDQDYFRGKLFLVRRNGVRIRA